MKFILLGLAIPMFISIGYAQNPSNFGREDIMNTQLGKAELRELDKNNSGDYTQTPLLSNKITEKRNSKGTVIVSYDFEEGMPEDFELIDGTCGWGIGWGPDGSSTSGGSTYFPIPDHDGKYAYINEDRCNGANHDVWMILPPLDFSDYYSPRITYDQISKSSDILTVKVSIDNKDTWIDFPTERDLGWITSSINFAQFGGEENVYIAFHFNDDNKWGYGWAIDNIIIEESLQHDLFIADLFPYSGIQGRTVVPKIIVGNIGGNIESDWTITITDGADYSCTVIGVEIDVDEVITVYMDEWTLPNAGQVTLTATLVLEEDGNPENNGMTKTIEISERYSSDAYIANLMTTSYSGLDILTGEETFISPFPYSTANMPRCDEYNGNYIYRLMQDKTISIIYPNGVIEPLGKLNGFSGDEYGVTMTYNWSNDKWYTISNTSSSFYSFDLTDFELTKISDSGISMPIAAFDFAHDGYIYGPSYNGNLYKIDPVTGVFVPIGQVDISLNFAQDVSFDYEHLRLYTLVCNVLQVNYPFGYYDLTTGKFVKLYDFGNRDQRTPFVIVKEPKQVYNFKVTVTDGSDPIEGATITIYCEEFLTTTVIYTDADGIATVKLTNSDYTYNINIFGYIPKSGAFTINNDDVNINETLTAQEKYTVTFYVSNIDEVNLNATVSLIYQGNTLFEGTAINGRIIFNNVFEGDYIYQVVYNSYETISGELSVYEDKTEYVTMDEIFGLPPAHLNVVVDGSDATLTWVNYVESSRFYWDPTFIIRVGVAANEGIGYGVVFDFTDHPYAMVNGVDFTKYSLVSGLYDYVVHVIDIENKIILYSSETYKQQGI